jgi:MFS family permease
MARPAALPLLALIAIGAATYGARGSVGLFVEPWEALFGQGRAAVSLVASIGFLAFGAGQILAGSLLARRPVGLLLCGGVLLCAAGFAVAAFATELPIAIAAIGIVASFGAGLCGIVTLSYVVTNLYRERHGALFGLLSAATAGGPIVVLPFAALALEASLRTALLACAAFMVVAGLLALVALHDLPAPPVHAGAHTSAGAPREGLRAVARDRRFWLLLLPFMVCGYTTTGLIDPHLIPYATGHHIGTGTASFIASVLAGFNVCGVMLAGILTDRVDRGLLLAGIYGMRGLTLLALPLLSSPGELLVFAMVFGLADYATVPPTTSLARSSFAPGTWALALSIISASHGVGASIGAIAGGWLFDITGGYGAFFVSAAFALAAASFMSLSLRHTRAPGAPVPQPA